MPVEKFENLKAGVLKSGCLFHAPDLRSKVVWTQPVSDPPSQTPVSYCRKNLIKSIFMFIDMNLQNLSLFLKSFNAVLVLKRSLLLTFVLCAERVKVRKT